MLSVVLSCATVHAQQSATPTFGTRTSAVVVDAVVRDRQGRPITDLTIKDFEILEDGVPQEIGALSMIAPEVPGQAEAARRVYYTGISKDIAAATTERTAKEGDDVPGGQTIVAIMFAGLSPESRVSAMKAAQAYLETPERPDDLVGVFGSSVTVQTFTNDRAKIRAALQTAAERATSFQNLSREGTGTGARPIVSAATRGGDIAIDRYGATVLQDLERQIDEGFRGLDNLKHGHDALNALGALVSGLALLPGRKTVIYFSDNLPLSAPGAAGGDGLRHRFDLVVGRANAANVSVYPVDAVGLRVHSQEMANGIAINNAAKSSLNSPDGSNGAAMSAGIEITQAGSTSHVFGRLAKETGGFVIENTNDLAAGFRRIDADRRFHYLLTYTPKNADFGGEYRRIEVKVERKGAVVRARSGYRADRSLATIPSMAYEAGPRAALTATPLPTAIPLEARALRLPTAAAPGQLALMVRVPAAGLRFDTDPVLGRYRTDAAILVRIRDETGTIVRKASQPYRLEGASDAQARAAQGDLVFFRQPSLPPGRYTVEYAVHDTLAGRAGAGTSPLDIPAPAPSTLGAGDLVIVQRAEQVKPGEVEPGHPLLVGGDLLLYPNLGEPLAAGVAQTITLYTVVRPAAGHPALTASLAVVRDRQTLVTARVEMGAPGADGFIRQVIRVPLPALEPGRYAIRLDFNDGQNQTARTARVTLR
ncbi:MAG: VWA domain-containing protein [Vicinamibacteria bacterium]|nr:VWA domain-containing protein [Vicinamibacteria bacterium]